MTSEHRSPTLGADAPPTYGQSLAGRLFRLVFGGYLLLAILVTAVQLVLEYASVQRLISADLVSLGQSFNGGVSNAMWEIDRPLMQTMARGIAQTSIVTGVRISSATGETMATVGQTPDIAADAANGLFAPFQFNASRLLRQTPQGERDIGELVIFANRSVALDRIKYSFIVILINSLVKTAGLWLIFYLVITRWLSRPLAQLTEVVSRIEFAADSLEQTSLDYPHQDELGRLMGSMRKMRDRLFAARAELEQVNAHLEETVVERTRHLSEALDFNETILLGSPLPMGVYAADGQCVKANAAYARLTGMTTAELLGQNFNALSDWQASGLCAHCHAALAEHRGLQHELNLATAFGSATWLECRILPVSIRGVDHLLIQFSDLTERKSLEEELRHYAFHDALTHLPNRRLLLDRLDQAMRSGRRQGSCLAVLFLDLNRFKQLNDTHGHEVGDLLLKEVAVRLQQTVRDVDTVARLGGDEFVILLEGLGADELMAAKYADSVAEKVTAALGAEYRLGEVRHSGSASIGIKLVCCGEENADEILRAADAAMYEVKRKLER